MAQTALLCKHNSPELVDRGALAQQGETSPELPPPHSATIPGCCVSTSGLNWLRPGRRNSALNWGPQFRAELGPGTAAETGTRTSPWKTPFPCAQRPPNSALNWGRDLAPQFRAELGPGKGAKWGPEMDTGNGFR